MPSGDLEFFHLGIAVKADDLHTVEQRLRNRICRVRCTNKHHIRQVVRHLHIVIGKGVILLRVKHLEQGTCRIPVVRSIKLIHLVQHHHRIRDTGLVNAVHNTPCHRSDISTSVAADICFITSTAERNAHILTT